MNDAEAYLKLYGDLVYVVPFYIQRFKLVPLNEQIIPFVEVQNGQIQGRIN